ncbi:sensor domain-containing diguanylate cyclase [Bacillus subtilis]|uniref:diguanylate cyclase n=1 Tax=Metapseudomonas otitidis TaxID=319939 RepID=A0ABU3XJJ2_9GAMM|nr:MULTISPECIES: sensor domain-containing diguanylate cyclase [Pseudomonas]MDL5600407.1 sensor domain-containing diguanylate cyclase [Bacillus subtilis]MDV3438072.1 sensor domain-containing diguanylate cyclase [Pseudomonas otitidis]
MDHILSLLSETVPKARTLEELTRPLLALLGQVTGMESTYLTTINTDEGIQRVEFARNVGSMVIPEGLVVPWADTLCKRALEEKRLYSDNVAECWGDSEAAAALGIKTYLSAPICSHDGRVLGTVCAASSAQVARSADVEPLLMLMSGLLSYSLERELLVERLQAANAELAKLALTDSLTGLSNRRAILSEFSRLFALAQREQKYVLVAVIDLDGFKGINDTYGHQAGDQLLRGVAAQLQACLRASDILGRTGGDEFVVIALGAAAEPANPNGMQQAARQLQDRLTQATVGKFELGEGLGDIHYPGASVGVAAVTPERISAEDALKLADREMYKTKAKRRKRVG